MASISMLLFGRPCGWIHFSLTYRSFPAISSVNASSGVVGTTADWLLHIVKATTDRAIPIRFRNTLFFIIVNLWVIDLLRATKVVKKSPQCTANGIFLRCGLSFRLLIRALSDASATHNVPCSFEYYATALVQLLLHP